MMEPEHPGRRSIRLKGYDYSQAGGYFVTIVTLCRECLFGEVVDTEMKVNALGRIAEDCWREIPVHFPDADVDAFVAMPNHVHGVIFIYDEIVGATHASPLQNKYPRGPIPGSLGAIIGSFKSAVTKRARRELGMANIWQRNYYEDILRDQADYEKIAAYILANPTKWAEDEEYSTG